MSGTVTDNRKSTLLLSLRMAFSRLDEGQLVDLANDLLAGELTFGKPISLDRNFESTDPALVAFLAPMGLWADKLASGVDDRIRGLRWDAGKMYMYVSRTA
jgi:hypothetical protein